MPAFSYLTTKRQQIAARAWLWATLTASALVVFASSGTVKADEPQVLRVDFRSPSLSAFLGQPTDIEANVLLPDSYDQQPERRYPVVYWIPEFDAGDLIGPLTERRWLNGMRGTSFEAIVVVMSVMFNGVAQEFADSANDGPWGAAFTREFIPEIDAHFRTLASPADRFVAGHSSGGWAALWLQVNYPDMFGGVWSISPDPVDFQSFCGPDLTKVPPGNFYHDDNGRSYELHDVDGQRTDTLQELATTSDWGPAQFASFETVFSPRGADGKPERLFDRWSGAIDASVAAYWEQHYDIAREIREHWTELAPKLRGKLHIIVGDDDNFRLNESVALLGAELKALGSDAEVDVAPGADHWTVMDWNGGVIPYMLREIALEHVNAVVTVPQPQPVPADPCASRRWSAAHLLAFCGPIRVVPADSTERTLWWGQRISEFLDAYASARGQSDLFVQRQVTVTGHAVNSRGQPITFVLRGQQWTIAEEEGVETPAQAEGNFLLKPFAAGGFGGYLVGFGLIDAGESVLTGLAPSLGLRPLDELSRRAIMTNNISDHLQGADSWLPVFTITRNVNAIVQSCESLAAESWTYDPAIPKIFIARAPKRCATIWP